MASREAATPQERLARLENAARFRVVVASIVCAAALFLEFLLCLTLPVAVAPGGMNGFLAFTRSANAAINPGFQLGLTVAVTLLGILLCVVGILAALWKYPRALLAYVPLQLVLAVMNIVCFVLTALVTERWGWFGALIFATLVAIVASFACALTATNVLMLPQYVSSQKAAVESRDPFVKAE